MCYTHNMRDIHRKFFITVLFFFFFFFFTPSSIFAQQSQLSQRWVCLKVDWCIDQDAFAQGKIVINPLCAPLLDATGKPLPKSHTVRLTAKSDAKPLPNKDTYIVECLATTNGQVCTTGSATADNIIYGKDNSAALNKTDDYQFQGIFKADGKTPTNNPVKSKTSGDIDPVEWQSYSKGNTRKFLALNFFDPNGGTGTMGQGGEQQGTFSFETQSNLKDCVSINWDPYGRIFDSQSLEPIPGASVELLKKRDNGSFTRLISQELLDGAIENPYVTKENGYYSFVIPDGTYKLSVFQQNYVFPNDVGMLNPGYTKAYSELYPQQTGLEIVQKGSVQHRDIPLDPKTVGMNYPIKLIEYFYNLDKSINKAILEGIVSHPLTRIRLYSIKPTGPSLLLTRYKLLKTIQADRYGKFSTQIDQSTFGQTEVFGDMELEKVDLTKNSSSKKNILRKVLSLLFGSLHNVEAAQSSISVMRFNPILNSLKGYAYDNKKNILPHANVGIYLAYSNKPYYETKTDEKGYYEIPSERLPDSPYNVKYSTVIGGTQITTTSKFIAQNNTYLEKNNINLNSNKATSKSGSTEKNVFNPNSVISSTKSGDRGFITKSEGSNFGSSSPTKQTTLAKGSSQNNSKFLVIVVILLFLIAGAGVLLGFYLIKKNKQH